MTPNKVTPPWLDDTQPLETLREERNCVTAQAFLFFLLGMSCATFVIAVVFLLVLT